MNRCVGIAEGAANASVTYRACRCVAIYLGHLKEDQAHFAGGMKRGRPYTLAKG